MSWQKEQTPLLKPADLFDKRKQRDSARLKAYNTILEQIYGRIKKTSRMTTETYITFTIPPFIMGLPRIDLEDCVVYIVYMLRQQNYEVRYTYPNLLYISWKQHEKEYILKGSPIMQAMLPVAPKDVKQQVNGIVSQGRSAVASQGIMTSATRSEPRVRFQDPILEQMSAPRAVARNPLDYKPPASFVQSMERPTAQPRSSVMNDLAFF